MLDLGPKIVDRLAVVADPATAGIFRRLHSEEHQLGIQFSRRWGLACTAQEELVASTTLSTLVFHISSLMRNHTFQMKNHTRTMLT